MSSTPTQTPATTPEATAAGPPAPRWGTGRVLAVVASSLAAVVGLVLLVGGVGVALASAVLHDDDGYYTTTPATWSSQGYAVRSEEVRMHGPMSTTMPRRMLGRLRFTAESRTGGPVFVGLAHAADVDGYLHGVPHAMMHDPWGDDPGRSDAIPGTSRLGPPTAQSFWVASSSGPGSRTIAWDPRGGDWTLVVMNPDGSAPVAVDVSVGARLPFLHPLAVGLLSAGAVVLVAAGAGLWLAVPRSRPPSITRSES